ncbi:BREX-1 system adenine-specific DNA-methyltransferase PglX [Butyricicoccus pullicaecorum]|uniref:BREX-1 system adenine-specific DNA-methyltransferase PglX n=1 Tax=Butyricicoccus pullicaecorum TaxID=501571 RepID=UPI0039904F56
MNKTNIKNFAIWARNKLIADIQYRAGLMGITAEGIKNALPQSTPTMEFYDIGTTEPYAITGNAIQQRQKLVEIIRQKEADSDYPTAYKYILEEVAYTWFNRLIAIRFMEVNDYLPSHIRVLSSETGKVEPDLVTTPFDAELDFTPAEEETILQLKTDNALDELFRLLFIKQCNALNEILPALFEKTSDYTELLLNLSVVDQDGVVYHLIHDIDEDDFNIEKGGQVEIIGWLYQYYNTEPKNAAFAKKGKITKDEIPAVTQLFTPDWIVRYMVQNSLGRLFIDKRKNEGIFADGRGLDEMTWDEAEEKRIATEKRLAEQMDWKYYLPEAVQTKEVREQLDKIQQQSEYKDVRDIKVIDPCMGSGHILVYAFDVLMQMYEDAGYSQRDAAKSILENNLYGLDIDDRAYQLAYFAVMMKARQYNRRILNGENTCHVYAIQESNNINRAHLKYLGAGMDDFEVNTARVQLEGLLDTLRDAKEYGSILKVENYNWELLRQYVSAADAGEQVTLDSAGLEVTVVQLRTLIDIAETMERKYDAVITNPPYMASSGMNETLSLFLKDNYPLSKGDLFAVFIERCLKMAKTGEFSSLITQQSWMFLSSYEKLRTKLSPVDVSSILHLGVHAFEEQGGEVVQTVAFILRKTHIKGFVSVCDRLVTVDNAAQKEIAYLSGAFRMTSRKSDFDLIPAKPYAYWISKEALGNFAGENLGSCAEIVSGMTTGNNDIFLRGWTDLDITNIAFGQRNLSDIDLTKTKWIPYHKGGEMRKWYGNHEYVVNWSRSSEFNRAKTTMTHVYLKPCITWSDISGNSFAGRYCFGGFMFDVKGSCAFASEETLKLLIGIFNSKVTPIYIEALNPTTTTQVGDLKRIPLLKPTGDKLEQVKSLVVECVCLSKNEWDSYEFSWDFQQHPLVRLKDNMRFTVTDGDCKSKSYFLQGAYRAWENECENRFAQLKANEEELNRIFIDIYGLQDELSPEVEDKDVTVRKADLQRDIKSLLSYAVGCMFGRYSLDTEGLAYAGGDWDESKYKTFLPDEDGILPITDEEYLGDDIVTRLSDWLKVVYGEDTLEENLDFIAKALGSRGNSSREIIRNYFLKDFFKDHCKIYQKRPIYWLFDSGKQNGFKALIYLHRYTPDTIGNLRVDYLHKMQRVYESEIGRMQDMIEHSTNAREAATSTKRKEKLQKQLKECRDYDEMIAHLALSRIELDLDDGVKVNYRKLQTAADGKFYEVLADSKSIMAKEK